MPFACPDYRLHRQDDFLHVDLLQAREVLSSAVLNGGHCRARHLLNWRVAGEGPVMETPQESLQRKCDELSLDSPVVGMMTAASLGSFRRVREHRGDVWIDALVTAGLGNARRAGDEADWRAFQPESYVAGTINLWLITNACLSGAAMVEALMIASEAKATVLLGSGVNSPISALPATGTGTDAVALVNGDGVAVPYCGKHVLFGEMLARAVIGAVSASLERPLAASTSDRNTTAIPCL